MRVSFRVTGKTPAELQAAADEVMRGFAAGADYTVTIEDDVTGAYDYSGDAPPDQPTAFSAIANGSVTS